jgi:DNA-binding NarL/FixJ family response regulator
MGQVEIVSREKDLAVCGQAGSAREMMEAIAQLKPDAVMMDMVLPDKEGLEIIKDVQSQYPHLPVLVVSMREEAYYAPRVLRAGARGYIMKSEGAERIVAAIRLVLGGQVAVSPVQTRRLLESVAGGNPKGTIASPEDKLTDREMEVLNLFGEGWSTEEIAQKLHLSAKTVDVHRAHIKEKLNLATTPEFLRFAIKWVNARARSLPSSGESS